MSTSGVHHVTAIAGDPQGNVDFYTGFLGLRLVKKTVNFDDPDTYHLYYGDELGRPGTILTFFPWVGMRRGQRGVGGVAATTFSIRPASLGFWLERLSARNLRFSKEERFGEVVLAFDDPDGLRLEATLPPLHLPGTNDAPTLGAPQLGFTHRWFPKEGATQTLLLLHGTGGDENDLVSLGQLLAPEANLLSPRGGVLENGMPRFFRRLAEGVFDEEDVKRRADELAEFVRAAADTYGFDVHNCHSRRLLQWGQHRFGGVAPPPQALPRRHTVAADGAF